MQIFTTVYLLKPQVHTSVEMSWSMMIEPCFASLNKLLVPFQNSLSHQIFRTQTCVLYWKQLFYEFWSSNQNGPVQPTIGKYQYLCKTSTCTGIYDSSYSISTPPTFSFRLWTYLISYCFLRCHQYNQHVIMNPCCSLPLFLQTAYKTHAISATQWWMTNYFIVSQFWKWELKKIFTGLSLAYSQKHQI